jgi:cytochrome oxidase assembly protein ShyY1
VIWLLAGFDLAAGLYLLGWALRRERRDRDAVAAVGVVLIVCALMLAGLGTWQLTQKLPGPPPTTSPSTTV